MAEFEGIRKQIVDRFHKALADLSKQHPEARIHIVAHSEGTVVSFLGLLEAMNGNAPAAYDEGGRPIGDPTVPAWLKRVRTYMTIGSPIDKHLLLWPDLFKDLSLEPSKALFESSTKIDWRNYYDFGDPVGFKLDSAQSWLKKEERSHNPFIFEDDHDYGFARYEFAGKAHNDYWEDPDVFDHFLSSAVVPTMCENKESKAGTNAAPVQEPPATKKLVYYLSPGLPYLISFFLFVGAVASAYLPVRPHEDAMNEIVLNSPGVGAWTVIARILGLTGLLIGVTLATRIPRLGSTRFKHLWGLLAFAIGATLYATLVDCEYREDFGERKKRKLRRGMRPFLLSGVVLVLFLIVPRLIFLSNEYSDFSLTLALIGLAAFFYFWWLAALIFDLGFVWQRYVRQEGIETKIGDWRNLPRKPPGKVKKARA